LSYFDIATFREADFLTDDMTEPAVCYRLFTLLRVAGAISSQPELISFMYRLSIRLPDFLVTAAPPRYTNIQTQFEKPIACRATS